MPDSTFTAPRSRDLLPVPAYENVPELVDDPQSVPHAELQRTLKDLRIANLLAGGAGVIVEHVAELTRRWPSERVLTVLDMATGTADIPLALAHWAERQGLEVDLLATDISPEVLEEARAFAGHHPRIRFEVMDALAPAYPPGSFDVVTCSLALHHMGREHAVTLIHNMARLCRLGFIISDTERCLSAYVATRLAALTPLLGRITRHDGPASIRRSFTASELWDMAREAGIHAPLLQRHRFWRQALVGGPLHEGGVLIEGGVL